MAHEKYDKVSLLSFLEELSNIRAQLLRQQDECDSNYRLCIERYSRLYGELEETIRQAANRLNEAQSMQQAAMRQIDAAHSAINSGDEDSAKKAQKSLQDGLAASEEANEACAAAETSYARAEQNMNELIQIYEKHNPDLRSLRCVVEDAFSAFSVAVNNCNRDSNEYISAMEGVREILYEGLPGTTPGTDAPAATAPHRANVEARKSVFRTKAGNSLFVESGDGKSNFVMTLGDTQHIFPFTRVGSAKAYREAEKFGDRDLMQEIETLYYRGAGATSSVTPENMKYVADVQERLEAELPETIDHLIVSAGAEMRKMNAPDMQSSSGRWDGSVFYLDDSYVPPKLNEKNLTVGEIRQNLSKDYGLQLEGIPYIDGTADFRSLSVASISTKDIVMLASNISSTEYDRLEPTEKAELFGNIFTKANRKKNFDYADQIAAERQIPIPGLHSGYTADELRIWRTDPDHHFSWDEQVVTGYHLIPSVIHGNVSHTGSVGATAKAVEYIKKRKKASPSEDCLPEENAPISITEVLKNN